MTAPLETDWKNFSAMVPQLRERYLAKCNARVAALLTDPKRNESERFWDATEAMKKEARVLRICLDDHARSRMWLSILTMIQAGMIEEKDLADFSEELRQEVHYAFAEKPGSTDRRIWR